MKEVRLVKVYQKTVSFTRQEVTTDRPRISGPGQRLPCEERMICSLPLHRPLLLAVLLAVEFPGPECAL
jgi:hypothetical protein